VSRRIDSQPKRGGGSKEKIETEKDNGQCCNCTGQGGIRLGKKSEACTALAVNARKLRKHRAKTRKCGGLAATAEYPGEPSLVRGASHVQRARHSQIGRKPSFCNSRGSDSRGHTALTRSIACSAGLASSETCSPRTARTGPLSTTGPEMSFSEPFLDSRAIRRSSQGIGFKMCRRNGLLPANAYAEFSEFGFCVGANPSADLVFGTDASARRNNPGTIRIPFYVFSILSVTAEAAGSSPIVPAIHSRGFARISLKPTRAQKGAFLHPFCIPFRHWERSQVCFSSWLGRIYAQAVKFVSDANTKSSTAACAACFAGEIACV